MRGVRIVQSVRATRFILGSEWRKQRSSGFRIGHPVGRKLSGKNKFQCQIPNKDNPISFSMRSPNTQALMDSPNQRVLHLNAYSADPIYFLSRLRCDTQDREGDQELP